MYQLNLPEYDYKLKKAEGKVWIFDVIRKKFIVLTPEEWVRQHFVNYLIVELGYPKALIKIEGGLKFNELRKRSDIVVFNRGGEPWMLIECKSPMVALSTDALQQGGAYNATLKAKFLTITNGLRHFCAEVNWMDRSTMLLDRMPQYE